MFIFSAIPSIQEFHRQNKFEGSGISEKVGMESQRRLYGATENVQKIFTLEY